MSPFWRGVFWVFCPQPVPPIDFSRHLPKDTAEEALRGDWKRVLADFDKAAKRELSKPPASSPLTGA